MVTNVCYRLAVTQFLPVTDGSRPKAEPALIEKRPLAFVLDYLIGAYQKRLRDGETQCSSGDCSDSLRC